MVNILTIVKYIVLILLILVIAAVASIMYILPKPHRFWYDQPVSWNDVSGDELIPMGRLPDYEIKLPPYTELRVFDDDCDYDGLCDFLNSNFSSHLRMSRTVIKSHLRKEGCANIGFYLHNELIGFIHGRPITIVYKDVEYTVHYVEYLCVKKENRGHNISPMLISRYVQEMERKLARDDLWFLFKKDATAHPFRPFIESTYLYMDMEDISGDESVSTTGIMSVSDANDKTKLYNDWILYSSRYKFHRSAIETEFFSPGTHAWICGIDRVAFVVKFSELYDSIRNMYDPVVDIEYIVELSDQYTENYPWTLVDLLNQWKSLKYRFVTMNDIGEHKSILSNLCNATWKNANPFQYYAFNFKMPHVENKDVYFTIN